MSLKPRSKPFGHWSKGSKWYRSMRGNHPALWQYIADFINEHDVRSLFEVGGGPGYVSILLPRDAEYVNVDLNAVAINEGKEIYTSAELIAGDFLTLDLSPYLDRAFDMFLAMSTLEHCPCFEDFFIQMLRLKFKRALLGFFMPPLEVDKDRILLHPTSTGSYYYNIYSRPRMREFLKMKTSTVRFEDIGKDAIMEIIP